jgi:hypothetical protein
VCHSVPRFVDTKKQLDSLLEHLKQLPCGHCGTHDTLIGHGFLRGYAQNTNEHVTRGRRFFCSNRGRRQGCGRTTSVLLDDFVASFAITATTLWALFCGLADGLSVQNATAQMIWPLSQHSAYRIARRVRAATLAWRSWLCAYQEAPQSDAAAPLLQLKEHLTAVLGEAPLKRFQLLSDSSVLP